MKVLITGTAGFIGMHLALNLSNQGYEVIGLDNINSYYDVNLKFARLTEQGIKKESILYNKMIEGKKGIKFIELDLQDAGNLQALFAKQSFDYVINLAAQAGVRYSITNPRNYIDSNISGFFNLLEASRNFPIKHLIYASSSSVYGNIAKVPFDESSSTEEPISFYAATKKTNEIFAHTYSHLYNIKTTGLRFFTVYGPWGRPDMAMFIFTDSIINNRPIDVYNNGQLSRDFTYIDDIVKGICEVLEKTENNIPYEIFNIGKGSPVNLMDFIFEIEKQLGKKAIINYLPIQEGDVLATYSNTDKLNKAVGYQPNTTIKEGIKKFITWYKYYYKICSAPLVEST